MKASARESGSVHGTAPVLNAFSAVGCIKRIYSPVEHYGGSTLVEHYNIEVVNCSFGSRSYGTEVGNRHLYNLGSYMLFIGSAGNNGRSDYPNWPGNHYYAMAIAAYDEDGHRAVWEGGQSSNYSIECDVAAPGNLIPVLDMYGENADEFDLGSNPGTYGYAGGTSHATAHVSAVAALVNYKWQSLWPQMVRYRIRDTEVHGLLPDWQVDRLGKLSAYGALRDQ